MSRPFERKQKDILWDTFWENTDLGLLTVNAFGEVQKCNKPSEKILGKCVKGMSITHFAKVTGVHHLIKKKILSGNQLFPDVLDDRYGEQISWFLLDRQQPEAIYTDITLHTLRDDSGNVLGAILIIKDVTHMVLQEQKAERLFEKLLRDSEAVWSAVPDLLFRLSKDEIYLDVRASKEDDLIVPIGNLIGSSLRETLQHKDVYHRWSDAIQIALETQKIQTIAYSLPFEEGLRYFEARIAPNGELEVLAIVRNITERWEAQKRINEVEGRFQSLFDSYPDILFRLSGDGTFLGIHAPREEELIAPKSNLLGKRIQDTHSEFLINIWKESRDLLRKTGKSQQVAYDLELQGKIYSFDCRMVYSAPDEVLMIIRNITNWKLAQKELAESEARFRAMAEALTNPIIIINASNGSVLYANQRLFDAVKLERSELIGKSSTRFFPDSKKRNELIQAIRQDGSIYDVEFEFVRTNGERFWMLFSANNIKYDGVKSIIASFVDITEWKMAQAQLLQTSKMASLGEMSAGIAHEINTPLATIRLSCFNAQMAWKNKDMTEAKKNLDLIDKEIARTSTIIQQMLNFSRNISRDEWEMIDLRDTMTQILLMLKNQLEAAGIDVILKLGQTPLWINGKTTQLQQVIYNIASNGKDAVQNCEKKQITFRIKKTRKNAILEIEDTGIGLTEEVKNNIFEPFYTTKPPGKGTGLGLSISTAIIKAHNGLLECNRARNGNGTVFRLKLPLVETT